MLPIVIGVDLSRQTQSSTSSASWLRPAHSLRTSPRGTSAAMFQETREQLEKALGE
jgi:hypothetical protein